MFGRDGIYTDVEVWKEGRSLSVLSLIKIVSLIWSVLEVIVSLGAIYGAKFK